MSVDFSHDVFNFQLYDTIVERLVKAYGSFMPRVGDPLDEGVLYGPMHSQQGIDGYLATLEEVKQLGGRSDKYYITF